MIFIGLFIYSGIASRLWIICRLHAIVSAVRPSFYIRGKTVQLLVPTRRNKRPKRPSSKTKKKKHYAVIKTRQDQKLKKKNMDFSKDNLNITSASSLLLKNENSTSYDLTENFITGNDTITGNGTASTERTVGNVTTPTDSPLQEYDYLNPVWNVAFSATVITGTAGNLIVLWIVLGKKNWHT